MLIFYKELSLAEGFAVSDLDKNSRIVAGREVSNCSGFSLFSSMRAGPIKCWHCGAEADRWISTRGQNDHSRPVLNLFATVYPKPTRKNPYPPARLVMMTRDHIIPKSMGGMDSIANLRPGCEVCNVNRGTQMNEADLAFMAAHPELISAERLAKGLKNQAKVAQHKADMEARRLAFVMP